MNVGRYGGDAGVRLVTEPVERVPGVRDLYGTHVLDEDTVPAHVFFRDATRETVRSCPHAAGPDGDAPDWRRAPEFPEFPEFLEFSEFPAFPEFLEERSTRGIAGPTRSW
ncbi:MULTISPECIES: hypothetical protein [unclassified Streptomyces]|uniref:hypothetical protein n=1 Tax=unclassified Streptomyces TaxID=2593676 RepID=UPI0038165B58